MSSGDVPDPDFWKVVVLFGVFMVLAFIGGWFMSDDARASMAKRCDRLCGNDSRVNDYSDDTHVCACRNGSVWHVRTVVEQLRAAQEPHP